MAINCKKYVPKKFLAALLFGAPILINGASVGAQTSADGPPSTPRERLENFIRAQSPPPAAQPAPAVESLAPKAAPVISPEIAPAAPEIDIAGPSSLAGSEPSLSDPGIQALKLPADMSEAELDSEIITSRPSPAPLNDIIAVNPPRGLTQIERENSIVRDFSQGGAALDGRDRPKSFGFFTSAKRYIAQRGQTSGPRLTLRYEVTSKNALTAVPGPAHMLDIILGEDYAAISKSAGDITIYDFKTRRILNVTEKEGGRFTNASLYAAAYQNIQTVGQMTKNGTQRSLDLGEGKTLDSFFLESALGHSASPLGGQLRVTQTGQKINASFKGEPVFSAALNGPKLEDVGMAYSFIGLLYHSEPVHPAILAELKELGAAPNAMTIHSYGPKYPDGRIFSWALKSKILETGAFPLQSSAKSIVEQKNISPMGYVVSEAIAGRALGGAPNPRQMLTAINLRLKADDPLSAWVSAQSLKDRLGGCRELAGLCTAISKAQARSSESEELGRLVNAFKGLDSKVTRLGALIELKPSVDAVDAPSLVLRKMAVNLSKTSKAEREAAGLGDMDPAQMLRQAIARNPYDPLAYQGLAQILAARGEFVQSWDMNDALRAFPDIPAALTRPIERAEAKLAARAPGYFPPVGG